jgi:hypothetical protein
LELCSYPIGGYGTICPDSKFAQLIRQNNIEHRTNQEDNSGVTGFGVPHDTDNIDPALLEIISQLQATIDKGP